MKRTGGFLGLLLLAGCSGSVYRSAEQVTPPVLPLPAWSMAAAPTQDEAEAPDRWWTGFGDANLERLVEEALARNLDLHAAWARFEQAAAVARQAGAGRWPEVSGEAGVSRAKSLFFAGEELGGIRGFVAERFDLGLAASYELDLWRRVSALSRAGALEGAASRADLEALTMTVSAQVADTWFSVVEQEAQRLLLRSQLDASERLLELVELRFSTGLATAVDVFQQRQLVAATRSLVPLADARARILANRLAILTGDMPGKAPGEIPVELPELPALPGTGVPADLIERRPDVRAAKLRAEAGNYRHAAAIAERLPALRLTGRVGYQGFESEDLFDNWIYSLAGNLTAPVFDAGRRHAAADGAEAGARERLALYGRALLEAIGEVENALVQEDEQRTRVARLDEQVEAARRNFREARERYRNGLSDYLPVLSSLESLHRAERDGLTARRELLSFRIQLCRALGGGWTGELTPPPRLALPHEGVS